ncbi:MAG: hypothetical protein HWE20_01150 [Gammaproteobacteria bacterium]|nr:hypothetical protein [Gammaproteobacteria bacterium]
MREAVSVGLCLLGLVSAVQADESALASYAVEGTELVEQFSDPERAASDSLAEMVYDSDLHYSIWQDVVNIVPPRDLPQIKQFQVFSDGEDETLAYVVINEEDDQRWDLSVDLVDGLEVTPDFLGTLIHEYGHILFLSPQDVPRFDMTLDDAQYDAAFADCQTYAISEGCPVEESVLAQFVDRFWSDIVHEVTTPDNEDLYDKYPERFITAYASTNPVEDLAETWRVFVLGGFAEGIPAEKLAFLAQFAPLLALRDEISANIRRHYPELADELS